MSTIKAFVTRFPLPAYLALTFAISWGAPSCLEAMRTNTWNGC
jgi:hypothetical protein